MAEAMKGDVLSNPRILNLVFQRLINHKSL